MENEHWLIEIEKDERKLDNTIRHIDFFRNEHWYKVESSHPLINNCIGKIWNKDGIFNFEIAIVNILPQDEVEKIMKDKAIWFKFSNDGYSLYANYDSFSSFGINILPAQGYMVFNGTLKHLSTSKEDEKKHSKFVAAIKCPDSNFIGAYFPAKMLKVGQVKYSVRIIELTVDDIQLQIYIYGRKNINENYLFIECLNKCDYQKFTNIIHEVLLIFTFITGAFAGKEIFILDDIYLDRNQVIIIGSLVYPEDISSARHGAVPKLNDGIKHHTFQQYVTGLKSLENLVEKCLSTPSFRRTLLLMIYANTQPDFIRVVLYAVALESITTLIYKDNKSEMKPISDKVLAKEIKEALQATLTNFSEKTDTDTYQKIKNSIENINKPTNKEMLIKPFVIYDIELSDNDKEAISKRNDFLHGRLPFEPGSHELIIIGYRLQFCVNALILKYCGYKGAAMYQSALHQFYNNLQVDSEPYKMI